MRFFSSAVSPDQDSARMTSSVGDHAEVAVAGLARMHEISRRAGRGEGRGDLAADMAGLAHAGDDRRGPLRCADQSIAAANGSAEPVADRRDERGNAAGLGFERAQRRVDQWADGCGFGFRVWHSLTSCPATTGSASRLPGANSTPH